MGFDHRPLLARVWLGQDDVPPLTHTLSLVTIDGHEWIADPGFGGSYCPPLPLEEGAEVTAPDGALFRLSRDFLHGWLLHRFGDGFTTDGRTADGGLQYSFTEAVVFPADLALGNHWTSTWPGSRFRQLTIVSLVLPQGFASLTDRAYRRRNGENRTEGMLDDPRQYRMRLSLLFGIDLTAEEVAGLGLF